VDTREPDRDKDLRSDKFFDAAHYPSILSSPRGVQQVATGKLKVPGDLTIHGTTRRSCSTLRGRLLL